MKVFLRREYLIIFKISAGIWMLTDKINVTEWFRAKSPSIELFQLDMCENMHFFNLYLENGLSIWDVNTPDLQILLVCSSQYTDIYYIYIWYSEVEGGGLCFLFQADIFFQIISQQDNFVRQPIRPDSIFPKQTV